MKDGSFTPSSPGARLPDQLPAIVTPPRRVTGGIFPAVGALAGDNDSFDGLPAKDAGREVRRQLSFAEVPSAAPSAVGGAGPRHLRRGASNSSLPTRAETRRASLNTYQPPTNDCRARSFDPRAPRWEAEPVRPRGFSDGSKDSPTAQGAAPTDFGLEQGLSRPSRQEQARPAHQPDVVSLPYLRGRAADPPNRGAFLEDEESEGAIPIAPAASRAGGSPGAIDGMGAAGGAGNAAHQRPDATGSSGSRQAQEFGEFATFADLATFDDFNEFAWREEVEQQTTSLTFWPGAEFGSPAEFTPSSSFQTQSTGSLMVGAAQEKADQGLDPERDSSRGSGPAARPAPSSKVLRRQTAARSSAAARGEASQDAFQFTAGVDQGNVSSSPQEASDSFASSEFFPSAPQLIRRIRGSPKVTQGRQGSSSSFHGAASPLRADQGAMDAPGVGDEGPASSGPLAEHELRCDTMPLPGRSRSGAPAPRQEVSRQTRGRFGMRRCIQRADLERLVDQKHVISTTVRLIPCPGTQDTIIKFQVDPRHLFTREENSISTVYSAGESRRASSAVSRAGSSGPLAAQQGFAVDLGGVLGQLGPPVPHPIRPLGIVREGEVVLAGGCILSRACAADILGGTLPEATGAEDARDCEPTSDVDAYFLGRARGGRSLHFGTGVNLLDRINQICRRDSISESALDPAAASAMASADKPPLP